MLHRLASRLSWMLTAVLLRMIVATALVFHLLPELAEFGAVLEQVSAALNP